MKRPQMKIPMRAKFPLLSASEWAREELSLFDERRLLAQARAGRSVCCSADTEPLVTIRIPTYHQPHLLAERAIASAQAQTYERIEILVIGDHCDDETARSVRKISDQRLRFINLPSRGMYPELAHLRRKVAGAYPMNVGNLLAEGAWIAPLDDDDELTTDHVEVLLAEAQRGTYEMVYSKAKDEHEPESWTLVGETPLVRGGISHGSVLYSGELRFLPMSMTCWKRREPSDWNLWKRMERIGVKIGFLDRVTFTHYLSEAGRTKLGRSTEPSVSG